MIKSVKIDPEGTHFPCAWLGKVKQLRKNTEFTFEPGLNIILGPNGSGKSTLTRSVARLFCAEQGGRPTLTQHAMMQAYDVFSDDLPDEFFTVDHDGGAFFYVNQGDTVGLDHGQFDDDFLREGLFRTVNKFSSGQGSCTNINRILALIEGHLKDGQTVDNRLTGCNTIYQKRIDRTMSFLKPDRNAVPVLVMDEPDASLDLLTEAKVWRVIKAVALKIQVIVCTHSVFALQSEAHFVEMEKGYRSKCLRAAAKLKT